MPKPIIFINASKQYNAKNNLSITKRAFSVFEVYSLSEVKTKDSYISKAY